MPPSFAAARASLLVPGVAVRGYDQVSAAGDFRRDDELRIGLHGDFDARGSGGGGEPVVGLGDHHPDDVHAALAQHVQGRHAEMSGSFDKGNPHDVSSVAK